MQSILSVEQVNEFYHDEFVEDQTRHFLQLVDLGQSGKILVDVGGGCGFFARQLVERTGRRVRVVDLDNGSIGRSPGRGDRELQSDPASPGRFQRTCDQGYAEAGARPLARVRPRAVRQRVHL